MFLRYLSVEYLRFLRIFSRISPKIFDYMDIFQPVLNHPDAGDHSVSIIIVQRIPVISQSSPASSLTFSQGGRFDSSARILRSSNI